MILGLRRQLRAAPPLAEGRGHRARAGAGLRGGDRHARGKPQAGQPNKNDKLLTTTTTTSSSTTSTASTTTNNNPSNNKHYNKGSRERLALTA